MLKGKRNALLALFLLAVLFRVLSPDTSYYAWDESVYMLHGQAIYGVEVGYNEFFLRPPLLPILISPLAMFENYEFLVFVFLAVLNSLIVVPMYFLGKKLGAGIYPAIIIAILPASIQYSRYVLTDHPGAILVVGSFTLMLYGLKNAKYFYYGCVLAGLAVLMKFTSLVLGIMIIPIIFGLMKEGKWKIVLKGIGLGLLTVTPYGIYALVEYGNPFFTFARAWHVVAESEATGLGFLMWLINDSLGMGFLLVMGIGLFVSLMNLKDKDGKNHVLYAGTVAMSYFFYIASRGTAKPTGIEWEVGRFMLVGLCFLVIFAGIGIESLSSRIKQRNLRVFVVAIILLVGIIILIPQYNRAYTEKIEFEEGLRGSTKQLGEYLSNSYIESIACKGNCPPIAYYSGKQVQVYYSNEELNSTKERFLVMFEEGNKKTIKEICVQERCAYLIDSKLS